MPLTLGPGRRGGAGVVVDGRWTPALLYSVAEGPGLTAQRCPHRPQETIMLVPAWSAGRCPAPGA